MIGGSVAIALGVVGFNAGFEISDDALAAISQVGATLLVAYAVEMSWFVKASRARDKNREDWVGFVTGVGLCSAVGIGVAIASIGRESTNFFEALAGTWMLFSLGLLGLLVASLPYFLYEWVHTLHTEYSDE